MLNIRPLNAPRILNRIRDRFFSYTFMFNSWRRTHPRQPKVLRLSLIPLTRLGLLCGFSNVDYAVVQGPRSRLHVGEGCSTMNTTFNVVSGDIWIGRDTLFSHGCRVATGTHRFHNGRRASLLPYPPIAEVPTTGRDIKIGEGCFFGAGATVIGPAIIGDNVIIGAGAVVTSDIPDGSFAVGVPARVMRPS
jgi:acetyltransferase-like isoleucine patch superfamily enzyme